MEHSLTVRIDWKQQVTRMERTKRIFTFLTFFVCTACLASLTASLATHKWLTSRLVRMTLMNGTSELLDDDGSGKFRGQVYFGLFQGTKILNYGFGDRVSQIWRKYHCQFANNNINMAAVDTAV